MEQAKKRDHKIYITDTAIDKISDFKISYYNDEENQLINAKHKQLLHQAQQLNNSNETAILFGFDIDEEAIVYGNENSVNIFSNPAAVSMSNRFEKLFLCHNHPSTQNFSYADLGVFLMNDCINGISAVLNMGVAHIIVKTDNYKFERAFLKFCLIFVRIMKLSMMKQVMLS